MIHDFGGYVMSLESFDGLIFFFCLIVLKGEYVELEKEKSR